MNSFGKTAMLLSIILTAQLVFAQYQIGLVPRVSPDREVYQKIGFTEIRITYGSPAVQGRNIWGELEDYDQVWRAGANNATTIEFSTDVAIEGQPLPKGKYAFFIIPRKNQKWTAIFSKDAKQWGAFSYQEEDDALRVNIEPVTIIDHQEKLTYGIESSGFNNGNFYLSWEKIQLKLNIETDYLSQFIDAVEAKGLEVKENIRWVVYLQGAAHLLEIGERLDQALQWVEKSKTGAQSNGEWNKQYYPKEYIIGHLKWTEAQLYAQRKELDKANQLLREVKQSIFYDYQQEAVDDTTKHWTMPAKDNTGTNGGKL